MPSMSGVLWLTLPIPRAMFSHCGKSLNAKPPGPGTRATGVEKEDTDMAQSTASLRESRSFVKSVHGIRYQVKDVANAISFYTNHLGFNLEHQQLPAFANVSLGDAHILLSCPGASGSRPMPNGEA